MAKKKALPLPPPRSRSGVFLPRDDHDPRLRPGRRLGANRMHDKRKAFFDERPKTLIKTLNAVVKATREGGASPLGSGRRGEDLGVLLIDAVLGMVSTPRATRPHKAAQVLLDVLQAMPREADGRALSLLLLETYRQPDEWLSRFRLCRYAFCEQPWFLDESPNASRLACSNSHKAQSAPFRREVDKKLGRGFYAAGRWLTGEEHQS
jgi:hypothetical protein